VKLVYGLTIALAVSVLGASPAAGATAAAKGTITVSGTGIVNSVPNRADFTFGVSATAPTATAALAADSSGRAVEVVPPRIDALCPIGAGDALAAAFVWAQTQKHDFTDSVRWGVAAGTASARLPGVSFASLEQTREIYARVETRSLQ